MTQYFLSLCAIAKNETPYIEEWVNFHRAVGVEHFFIYDNESDVPIKTTLKKYIEAGLITVIDFPGKGQQMPSYTHCIQTFGHLTKWLAILDADEFLVPKTKDSVPEILLDFEHFGGLNVNWVIFGSNGLKKKPDGLTIENFTAGSDKSCPDNAHTKAIIQPERTLSAGPDPHHCKYRLPFFSVSEHKEFVPGAWASHSNDIIQINHYFLRSLEEFETKVARGRADTKDPNAIGRQLHEFDKFDQHCDKYDDSALRFLQKTKDLYIK